MVLARGAAARAAAVALRLVAAELARLLLGMAREAVVPAVAEVAQVRAAARGAVVPEALAALQLAAAEAGPAATRLAILTTAELASATAEPSLALTSRA
jgi:hypothetical protein